MSRGSYYFDNCAICQTLKTAEQQGKPLTTDLLQTAFYAQKQKQLTGQVGKQPGSPYRVAGVKKAKKSHEITPKKP